MGELTLIYKKIAIVAVLSGALSIALLSGWFGKKPEENVYVAFENAAKQEKTLFDDSKKMNSLEKEEEELYVQILGEGKDYNKKIVKKIDEAITNVDEREKVLKHEKKALEKAQKEMKSVPNYVDKMEDKKLQNKAKEVEKLYKNRYKSFQKMNEKYTELLTVEKELYEQLKVKETKLKEIGEKVKTVNALNEKVQEEKEIFNRYTKKYNEEKVAFYKEAKMKVKVEK